MSWCALCEINLGWCDGVKITRFSFVGFVVIKLKSSFLSGKGRNEDLREMQERKENLTAFRVFSNSG